MFYRFCDNTHDGRFGWCRPFDEGADQWEQVAAVVDDYEGYTLYNFRRDRLGFGTNMNGYLNRSSGALRTSRLSTNTSSTSRCSCAATRIVFTR